MYNLTTSLKNLEFIINIIEPMLENSSEIEQLYRINQKYIDDINNYYEPNIIVNKKGRKRKRGRKKKQLLLLNSDRQPEQQHQQEPKRIYRRRKFPESDRKTRKRFKIDENHNEKQLIKSTPRLTSAGLNLDIYENDDEIRKFSCVNRTMKRNDLSSRYLTRLLFPKIFPNENWPF
uniref:Uncharacterized protein LOC113798168 n=1 Tax=Dermatophagoides pteronyssinus TaxID=6956 RepID=A0A6P6YHY4_DERPT|nr:uncharacterized protein LOC113798168 [Dermatophagoides pteronyssinus]